MAYEFELQGELEGPYVDDEGSRIVEFALGYDVDTATVVVMSIMLLPTNRPDTQELCFGIRTKILAKGGEISAPDYSHEAVTKYIPENSRRIVRARITEAVSRLVKSATPVFITMETFYANLPDKALKKYEGICGIIRAYGYEVADQFRDGETGIDFWLFMRND